MLMKRGKIPGKCSGDMYLFKGTCPQNIGVPGWLKRMLRDAVSLIVWVAGVIGRRSDPGIRILVYHAIADAPAAQDPWRLSVPPKRFAAQIRWLRCRGYTFLSLADVLEVVRGDRPLPKRAVALTFDDGFADVASHAHPLLRDARLPFAVFMVPQYLDHSGRLPWLTAGEPFASALQWKQAVELARDPLVSIGSHGWTHRRLTELDADAQRAEVERSKALLEERLARPVTWFAYPYGDARSFSAETIAHVRQAGYEAALSNVMGAARVGESPWTLKRTRVLREDRLWRFRIKMAGGYDWLDRVRG